MLLAGCSAIYSVAWISNRRYSKIFERRTGRYHLISPFYFWPDRLTYFRCYVFIRACRCTINLGFHLKSFSHLPLFPMTSSNRGRTGLSTKLSPFSTKASLTTSWPFRTTHLRPIRRLKMFPYFSANYEKNITDWINMFITLFIQRPTVPVKWYMVRQVNYSI